jgi:hypothetical protein
MFSGCQLTDWQTTGGLCKRAEKEKEDSCLPSLNQSVGACRSEAAVTMPAAGPCKIPLEIAHDEALAAINSAIGSGAALKLMQAERFLLADAVVAPLIIVDAAVIRRQGRRRAAERRRAELGGRGGGRDDQHAGGNEKIFHGIPSS